MFLLHSARVLDIVNTGYCLLGYNFKHYDIRETVVQFDDQKFEVKTNFTTGNVGQAYARLFKERGIQDSGLDCGITL